MKEKIQALAKEIRGKIGSHQPKIAIVLGSGLGGLADCATDAVIMPYDELNGFPKSTVKGHVGRLVVGKISGCEVICMQGRIHYYEGMSSEDMALPVRLFKELGVETMILTNAAGSLREEMPPGSLMVISDHINFSGFSPLRGPNDDTVGERFVDMSKAYNSDICKALHKAGKEEGVKLFEGTYIMYSGPNFETPAEIKMFRMFPAEAIGMSTAPECIYGVHCGLNVAAISVITNYAVGLSKTDVNHKQTLAQANISGETLQRVIKRYLQNQ